MHSRLESWEAQGSFVPGLLPVTLREWVGRLSPKALLSREVKGQRAREGPLGSHCLHPPISRTLLTGAHYSCHLHLPFWILKTRNLNTPWGVQGE